MKKTGNILILALIVVFLMGANGAVHAETVNYVENVILIENAIPRRLTEVEFNKIKEDSSVKSIFTPNNVSADYSVQPFDTAFSEKYNYIISSSFQFLDYSKEKFVTPIHGGGGSISYGESSSHSTTFSLSLNLPATDKVKATVGGSHSASSNKQFGMIFTVPSGTQGRVVFVPMIKVTRGTLVTLHGVTGQEIKRQSLNVFQPVKVNSFADGLFYLKTI